MTKDEIKTLSIHQNIASTIWLQNPYLAAATSNNTRRAYRSDIRHFERWGGKLPATPEMLVNYLQAYATSLNPRTLARRLISIRHWHTYQGFPDPTANPVVNKTLKGIARTHGKPKTKAHPLTPESLAKIAEYLNQQSTLASIRDNALLQVGYFGALRRSELVNIHVEHIRWTTEGIEILLPRSKTDQSNDGQFCAIPYGNSLLCPVTALKNWLEKSEIQGGAVFRSIQRGERIRTSSLTPLSINLILQKCANAVNLPERSIISSHSLRRGLATSAALAGAPLHTIMQAGRWKQTNTVVEYIDASERFKENAASSVLKIFSKNRNTINEIS